LRRLEERATPTLSWSNPAAIVYGTLLSDTQLDATASFNGSNLAGTFVYSPATGTVLGAGVEEAFSGLHADRCNRLHAGHYPDDSRLARHNAHDLLARTRGQSAKKVFKGALVLSTTATRNSLVGQYAIMVKQGTLQLINKNYEFKFVNGILQVVGKPTK